jgi:hypothetical protein
MFALQAKTMGRVIHFEIHAEAQAGGGKVVLPTMPIPGVGWLAYCSDTEGNIFGMMQADPKAATEDGG